MSVIYFLAIIFFIIGLLLKSLINTEEEQVKVIGYNISESPMTKTEKNFMQILKKSMDKYGLLVLPQVQLQSIFKANNISSFNKIKAKSVDFAIVDNNYNFKLFIELDDYTHNRASRKNRDIFVNELFKTYNLKLIRIKVSNNYNIGEIENIAKEVV